MSAPDRSRTVAVIPARGGSKGVPGKNLRAIAGRTLLERAVTTCRAANGIDEVVVSTDDDQIAAAAVAAGARAVRRPAELAGDQASSESALLHALDQLAGTVDVGVLVFVQCTSPFIRAADLDAAVATVRSGRADCVFAAVETYDFIWTERQARSNGTANGTANGTTEMVGRNHDASVRLRRQDRRPDYRETGAFYVMDAAGFRAAGHRFFGRTVLAAVPSLTAVEIDTEDDLLLAAALAPRLDIPAHGGGCDVDLVVTDFDGVHTDDLVGVDQHGTETVRVSRSDGLGISRLRAAGVPLVIVSKERNPVVAARAAKLGVEVLQGVEDKAAAMAELLGRHQVDPVRVAYLGNDVNDLPALAMVGWPVAVPDAHPDVLRQVRLVLRAPGGQGAVRELCDLVLAARTRLSVS